MNLNQHSAIPTKCPMNFPWVQNCWARRNIRGHRKLIHLTETEMANQTNQKLCPDHQKPEVKPSQAPNKRVRRPILALAQPGAPVSASHFLSRKVNLFGFPPLLPSPPPLLPSPPPPLPDSSSPPPPLGLPRRAGLAAPAVSPAQGRPEPKASSASQTSPASPELWGDAPVGLGAKNGAVSLQRLPLVQRLINLLALGCPLLDPLRTVTNF